MGGPWMKMESSTRAGTAHAFRFIFVTTGLLTLVRYSKGNLFDCLGLLEAASELTLALAGCTRDVGLAYLFFPLHSTLVWSRIAIHGFYKHV